MGTKYPTQSISGYNATPPADDGTAVEANRTTWAKHKTKLGDPIKTLAEAVNTAMVTYVSQETVDKAGNFTTTVAEHKKTINVTGAYTISLGDAGTMGVSYMVTVKNSHTAAITVDLDTAGDTLDGTAAGSVLLAPKDAMTFVTNAAANGYYKIGFGPSTEIVLIEVSDHMGTSAAGNGIIWLKDDAPTRPYFTDDTAVDRKIVTADTTVSNHVRAGNTQLHKGDTSVNPFAVDSSVTTATWESVGPTGSGADNIYTEMDVLPANASIWIANVYVDLTQTSASAQSTLNVFVTSGDDATPSNINRVIHISSEYDSIGDETSSVFQLLIPLDPSNQTFQVYWNVVNSSQNNIDFRHAGFMTD